jgi:hypothetical protein
MHIPLPPPSLPFFISNFLKRDCLIKSSISRPHGLGGDKPALAVELLHVFGAFSKWQQSQPIEIIKYLEKVTNS